MTCLQKMECLTAEVKQAFNSSSFVMRQLYWARFQMVDNIIIVFIFSVLFRDASIFTWRNSPPVGQGLLIIEDSWSQSDTAYLGRTPLDERSARRRDFHLTTHNTHKRQTSMPPTRFEPTISAGERPQTHGLGRAATGTGDALVAVLRYPYGALLTWLWEEKPEVLE